MLQEKKNKHMTLKDRIELQECLSKGMTFKAIARRIGKDPTTVSREVKNRSVEHRNSFSTVEDICPLLLKAPFVCNGCSKHCYASCHFVRRLYIARRAQHEYETTLVESREGIPLNKESFYEMDAVLSSAVRSGQSIYHAIHANALHTSQSSVYRYVLKGIAPLACLIYPGLSNSSLAAGTHQAMCPGSFALGAPIRIFGICCVAIRTSTSSKWTPSLVARERR